MPFVNELRDRFATLRDADVDYVPDLRSLVAREPVDRRIATRRKTTFAVVALTALVVGVLVTQQVRADRSAAPAARWESPTTSLVPTTGQSVLAPAPLLSSVLDGATQSTLWHNGD